MNTFKLAMSIAAVVMTVTPAAAAPFNSVFHFDELRKQARGATITEAVLDGSIYPEIDQVHPLSIADSTLDVATRRRERNREAVQEHCKRERRVTKPADEGKCGAGFRSAK